MLNTVMFQFFIAERPSFPSQRLQFNPQQCLYVLYICGPGRRVEACWRGLHVPSYRAGQCTSSQDITLSGEI